MARSSRQTHSRSSAQEIALLEATLLFSLTTIDLRTWKEIDATVLALMRQRRWRVLERAMRRYALRFRVPANLLLCVSFSRQLGEYLRAHPEHEAEVVAGLDAAEEELVASGRAGRVATLGEIIGNLRQAAERCGGPVH